jgi:PAS domain S-box-containing protein
MKRASRKHPRRSAAITKKRARVPRRANLAASGFEGIALTEQGIIIDANPQLADMMGHTPPDIIGRPFTNLVAPKSRVSFAANVLSGGDTGFELRALKRDGSTFPVEIRSRLRTFHGRPALVVIVRDITARKGTEELLRESEESFRELAESVTDVFFATDPSLTVTYWNKATEYLTGVSSRDAIGNPLLALLPALAATGAEPVFRNVMMLREPRSFTATITFAEGPITAEIRVYPGRRGLSVFVRDITEQKHAEQALRDSEERFRNIYEESPIGIQLCDAAGTILDANKASREIFGVNDSTALNSLSLLTDPGITPEKSRELRQARTIRFETTVNFDTLSQTLATRRSGTATIEVQITPLGGRDDREPAGYLVHVQDTTDRKRAEEQIRNSLVEKEALLKEIHHRVKNNLQIVSSLLSLQAEYVTNEKALEALRESQNRVRSMAMIHRQLYNSGDLARIDFEHYVHDLADQIFRTYSLQAGKIRLELQIDPIPLGIDKAIPCGIIVNELISNCLKHAFTDRPSGVIRVSLRKVTGDSLELAVEDDGVGLPEEMDLGESPSLGLRLVRTLAEQLRGTVDIRQGAGTSFTIRFPAG